MLFKYFIRCYLRRDIRLFQDTLSEHPTPVSMYFHFQLLTDIANISARYGTPEHRQILRLRTVEVLVYTALALQQFLDNDLSGRLVARFKVGDGAVWSDIYQLWNGVMLVTMFVVMIWLCKLLFNLKKSLMREFCKIR